MHKPVVLQSICISFKEYVEHFPKNSSSDFVVVVFFALVSPKMQKYRKKIASSKWVSLSFFQASWTPPFTPGQECDNFFLF